MSVQKRAFAIEASSVVLELISPVAIGLPIKKDTTPEQYALVGLWDTGATGCAVASHVIQAIKPPLVGVISVGGVHGREMRGQYLVSMMLPNHVGFNAVPVTELSDEAGCDVLIGMDVICRGDFSTSTIGGKTSFTFRMPAFQKQNFVTHTPNDNSQCTCGSGRMFKNCCKKLIREIPGF